ncbi:hypothetical protein [uncultured Novosphingobium sp.]|uniref:hypothetical protein n=1 Tax=uncultured Novosphingobium sp. TaxID=292277 RepID=UPI002591CEA5|nr:hypothetical protein [uncultured Novosphingobium sp.]
MTGETDSIVPPFDGSPRSIAIIKRAAKEVQSRKVMSFTKQADELAEWAQENAKDFDARAFTMSKQRWTEFVNRSDGYKTVEPDLLPLAWRWFFEVHRFAIEPLWLTMPIESPAIPNPLVPTLHAYLSPDEPDVNLARLKLLEGDYVAYRPDFNDPEQIMATAMKCGVEGDISRFSIAMKYVNDDGEDTDETVDGFIIPYQDSVLFQGWMVEAASPFIFVLSGFPKQPKTRKISGAQGTLLVGAGGTLSSAYPILIRRVEEAVEPCVYDPESLKATVHAHKSILQFMTRGVVGWR